MSSTTPTTTSSSRRRPGWPGRRFGRRPADRVEVGRGDRREGDARPRRRWPWPRRRGAGSGPRGPCARSGWSSSPYRCATPRTSGVTTSPTTQATAKVRAISIGADRSGWRSVAWRDGRGGRIRTGDLLLPKQAICQTDLRPGAGSVQRGFGQGLTEAAILPWHRRSVPLRYPSVHEARWLEWRQPVPDCRWHIQNVNGVALVHHLRERARAFESRPSRRDDDGSGTVRTERFQRACSRGRPRHWHVQA